MSTTANGGEIKTTQSPSGEPKDDRADGSLAQRFDSSPDAQAERFEAPKASVETTFA